MVEARADVVGERRRPAPSAPSRAAGRRNRARSAAAWPRHRRRTAASARRPSPRTRERAVPSTSLDRHLGIDAARVDGKAGALGRKAALRLREAELVPHQVHQVGGILAVMDREGGIEADLLGIFAQQPRADAVERARPRSARRPSTARAVAQHLARDALDAPRHFGRGAAREGHQQDAARIGAVDDQMRDAVRQRVGLARARAGDDQQRRPTVPSAPTPCSTARRCCGLSLSR